MWGVSGGGRNKWLKLKCRCCRCLLYAYPWPFHHMYAYNQYPQLSYLSPVTMFDDLQEERWGIGTAWFPRNATECMKRKVFSGAIGNSSVIFAGLLFEWSRVSNRGRCGLLSTSRGFLIPYVVDWWGSIFRGKRPYPMYIRIEGETGIPTSLWLPNGIRNCPRCDFDMPQHNGNFAPDQLSSSILMEPSKEIHTLHNDLHRMIPRKEDTPLNSTQLHFRCESLTSSTSRRSNLDVSVLCTTLNSFNVGSGLRLVQSVVATRCNIRRIRVLGYGSDRNLVGFGTSPHRRFSAGILVQANAEISYA